MDPETPKGNPGIHSWAATIRPNINYSYYKMVSHDRPIHSCWAALRLTPNRSAAKFESPRYAPLLRAAVWKTRATKESLI